MQILGHHQLEQVFYNMMRDFRFPLSCDIYYAKMQQDEIGAVNKVWELGRQDELCELHSDKFNSDTRYAIATSKPFYEFPLLLFGRFVNDIRVDQHGDYQVIQDIMITNIRDDCGNKPIFLEPIKYNDNNPSNGDMDVLFDLISFAPFTNPWGQIEYYRAQVSRMAQQTDTELDMDPSYI